MKEVTLPSGALLKITPSPFAISKALYQALMREAKGLSISANTDLAALYKDLFCTALSSEGIEKCVWECMKRCTYNYGKGDLKIDESTFEAVERREDYLQICVEVTKENILPFMKSLYAEYQRALSMIGSTQP